MNPHELATHLSNPRLPRLLAGPRLDGRAERLVEHLARLGPLPFVGEGHGAIASLIASGLLGRGGAGYPVGRKWQAVADRRDRSPAVVIVNGAEGEPWSWKDRTLMAHRPQLVIDGALLAAAAVRADDVVLYVGEEHVDAAAALRRALVERSRDMAAPSSPAIHVVTAPTRYVAGEASAAVRAVNDGDARPTTTPPRVSERGVAGRPTLVQNVESLAYAALIARFGAEWYREAGHLGTRGTALITVTGAVARPGVQEIELGTTIRTVAEAAGAEPDAQAVMLGGYFGTWVRAREAWDLPLDPAILKAVGLTFGCGIVAMLPAGACGVEVTAQILGWMSDESAGQCGPCVLGLGGIRAAAERLAFLSGGPDDLENLERWAGLVIGRGACHHPDGAAQLLMSARRVFDDEFRRHAEAQGCSASAGRRDVA